MMLKGSIQCIPSAVSTVAVGAPEGGHSPFCVGTIGTAPELEPVVVPELDPELEPVAVPELDPAPAPPLELPLIDASVPEMGVVTMPVGSEQDAAAPVRQANAVKAPSANQV